MQTGLGILAILFWALGSSMLMCLTPIPMFEMMFLSWLIVFICFAIKISIQGHWPWLKQPISVYFIGTLGIGLSDLLFVYALRLVPAAQAHVLGTIWPLLIGITLVVNHQQRIVYLISVIIGFSGVYIFLMQNGNGMSGFQIQYLYGYIIAFVSNIPWIVYVLFSKKNPRLPTDLIGVYSGFAAIAMFACHYQWESWYTPSINEWGMLLLKSITASGFCYVWWDLGIRWGNMALLNVLYYFTPILGVGFLVLFGWSPREWGFLEGSILILIATAMVGIPYHRLKKKRE